VVLGNAEPVLAELRARPATAPRAPAPAPASSPGGELDRYLAGETPRVSLKRVAREAAQVAEARLIARVLQRTRWNRKEAAAILQISYKALLYKMRDAGLSDSPYAPLRPATNAAPPPPPPQHPSGPTFRLSPRRLLV